MIERELLGLDRAFTQQIVLERDEATVDEFGAEAGKDWQPLETVIGFHWWGSGASITRAGQIQARPELTVDLNIGGAILPEGTDVTARDRISQILDQAGNVVTTGPLEILAVMPFEGVTELTFRKVT